MNKMFDSLKKSNIFSTLTFALIILVFIFADKIISFSSHENIHQYHDHHHLQSTRQTSRLLQIASTDNDDEDHGYSKQKPDNILKLFETSDHPATRFDSRVRDFFSSNKCKLQFFMTWISSADSFGEREFFGLESLSKTNPKSCLIILSSNMDSRKGRKILEPLISRGFRVQAMAPDLWDLIKKTPAESWLRDIKNGNRNPGQIPLPQNLSNLIRLVVLYKYGGVYLDTDFIILKDFTSLRNSIGAQSIDIDGNWTRLNNAVLVFDKQHPLVYKFIEEFALNFDGNIWGHNGPYLVSRVAKTVEFFNFTVLPPTAFYPVDWTRISTFFTRPNDPLITKWVEAKIRHLNRSSYGVHLWNRQSSRFKIEEGSIIWRLISAHCVICKIQFSSS